MSTNPTLSAKIPLTSDLNYLVNGKTPFSGDETEFASYFNAIMSHAGLEALLHGVDKKLSLEQQFQQILNAWAPQFKPKFTKIMANLNRLTPKNAASMLALPHLFMHIASKLFPFDQDYPITDQMRWIAALTTIKSESNFGIVDNPSDNVFGPLQMKEARWDDAYNMMLVNWGNYFNTPEVIAIFESYGLDSNFLAVPPVYGLASFEEQLPIMVACLLQNESHIHKHWSFMPQVAPTQDTTSWGQVPSLMKYDGLDTGVAINTLSLLMAPFKNVYGIVQPSYQTMFTAYHIYPAWATKPPIPITIMHKEADPNRDRYIRDIVFSTSVSSQWKTLSGLLERIKSVINHNKLKTDLADVRALLDPDEQSSVLDSVSSELSSIKKSLLEMFSKW